MASLKLVRNSSHVLHLTVGSKPLHPDKKMSACNFALKLHKFSDTVASNSILQHITKGRQICATLYMLYAIQCFNILPRYVTCAWRATKSFGSNINLLSLVRACLQTSALEGLGVCSSDLAQGVFPEKLDGGVRPASQNPYPIYDQDLRYSLPYL